jgi:hypothetical protein
VARNSLTNYNIIKYNNQYLNYHHNEGVITQPSGRAKLHRFLLCGVFHQHIEAQQAGGGRSGLRWRSIHKTAAPVISRASTQRRSISMPLKFQL